MKSLKAILVDNRYFFGFFLFFFGIGLILLLTVGKAASFIDLNPYHRSMLDTLFHLSDLPRRRRFCCHRLPPLPADAALVPRLPAHFGLYRLRIGGPDPEERLFHAPAKTILSRWSIPLFYRRGNPCRFCQLPLRPFHVHLCPGYPAGYLRQATRKAMSVYLLVAVAVGYSRIYLGQHFLGDVLTGSSIGVLTAVLVFFTPVRF
jgi:hypothetical protein